MSETEDTGCNVIEGLLGGCGEHFDQDIGDYALSLSEQIARLAYVAACLPTNQSGPVQHAIAKLTELFDAEVAVRVQTARKALDHPKATRPARITALRPVAPREDEDE